MKRLAILGAGGHGKVVADIALSSGWNVVEFYDDIYPAKTSVSDFSIKGGFDNLLEQADSYDGFHVAIGDNKLRLNFLKQLLSSDFTCPNIIAPSSVISSAVKLGSGVSIMPNAVVNAKTIIGDGAILNTSCSVDHDCEIAAGVHICPGAHLAGDVSVGFCSFVGIGSTIIQGKIIGDEAIIGAASLVINNIPDNVTAVGIPSKIIK